ncbi:sulfur oxidation c-type cytochrome SoxX [Hydrogenophilus thermoluteolus]|nr:sulfur oxidation c-type cytochrome SoxX [Hydrogenophilus thermoluteolus]MBW7656752.1 sulfur oxidation c-type cytochrome SoxX [Hydrogenophilus thermoluteolus]HCO78207.1 sulfur oxidation c-type cytochrome SoxX [Rhodocyclaceae bacterium]
MKKVTFALAGVMGFSATLAWAGTADLDAKFKEMIDRSFKTTGIAQKERMIQLDFQKVCSALEAGEKVDPKTIEQLRQAQEQTIRWPSDGQFLGDWKRGEKIAQSGRGLTWSDKPDTVNGGGCYNCHQLDPKELSYGNIGPSLAGYGKLRGNSEEVLKYAWRQIWNSKSVNLCSSMPRFGDAGILTEQQIKDVMAYLFDPESPVNKNHK